GAAPVLGAPTVSVGTAGDGHAPGEAPVSGGRRERTRSGQGAEPARGRSARGALGTRTRALVAAAVVAVVVLIGVVIWFNRSDDGTGATAGPTASGDVGTAATAGGPLLAALPTEVTGGEFGSDGPSGTTFTLGAPGYVTNPVPPAGSTESYVGVFAGAAVPVTLTASRFGTSEAAAADAQATAATIGTAVESGPVFPDDEASGTYWIFNEDGLVTIVWNDEDLGSYTVVAEDAEAALDFYHGLDF
ncbi:MAG TPA: hypothetical protein DHV14_00290, partial [Micrococcales bacterium]|nr:hypothetical protein [Micrococcales bacterium]